MKVLPKNILFKVLSMNALSVMVSFVLGVFSSKIIAVFLGTSGMALMGSFRNFIAMVKSTATMGINNAVIKLFVENKEDKKELSIIYSTFFWMFLMLSILLCLIIVVFASSISKVLFFSDGYSMPIRFLAFVLPLMVINTFWMAIYNSFEQYKRIVLIQIIANVLIFGATAFLVYQHQILGGLLSVIIGEVVMVLVTLWFVRGEQDYFRFELQRVIQKKYFRIISTFSVMALLSAVIIPLTLILIREALVNHYSVHEAGLWDGINRLSGFYMMFFSSGLSLYYMPKLAAISTVQAFKSELKLYFNYLVPFFLGILLLVYAGKEVILSLAFTEAFYQINDYLVWQLAGDFMKIVTLAFGYHILVKTMIAKYFAVELLFNCSYYLLACYLMQTGGVEGVVKAYFYANLISLGFVLFLFRKLLWTARIPSNS